MRSLNDMVGQLEKSFPIEVGLPAEAFLEPSTRLGTVRAELATFFENKRLSMGVAQTLLCLLKETERLSDIARNLATPSCEGATQIRTERLRFYLGAFAATELQHVCVLTEKLGADLASEARGASDEDYLAHW